MADRSREYEATPKVNATYILLVLRPDLRAVAALRRYHDLAGFSHIRRRANDVREIWYCRRHAIGRGSASPS